MFALSEQAGTKGGKGWWESRTEVGGIFGSERVEWGGLDLGGCVGHLLCQIQGLAALHGRFGFAQGNSLVQIRVAQQGCLGLDTG